MKLYFAPGTCALACWIALEWANADYEVQKVDPRSDEYKAINPLAVVPALDIGTGRIMGQADAILQYVAERYPEVNLGANDGLENQFIFHETMCFLTSDFHPAFWPYFVPQRYTVDESEQALENVRLASHARIERVMDYLENLLAENGFVYGNKRSVADAYAFVMARWTAKLPKSWKDYPHINAFMNRMLADEAVQKVLTESQK